ncbi:Dihydroorotate dehydrogenase B (NAD(+)), catalytic subunit [Stieleria bergensis]|uniref:Dihydroorotate dehydrogenase B (NAD(+)), catalytic subunit n=1 Tax=Stieleria bergensis TaxID=2528025 RepID=A0A517SP14_9BACT|nr:Dihydroorotate dehydrogenase B (NAD(+)), catalytic subunit [Planctomycetes bacterium SV_7m_r]
MSVDLSTNYGGLQLASPIVVGANPLTSREAMRLAMANAGAGALVLPSLFEDETVRWFEDLGIEFSVYDLAASNNSSSSSVASIEHDSALICTDTQSYLDLIDQAASRSPIPVIASLGGTHGENWPEAACLIEQAGAQGIELNFNWAACSLKQSGEQIEQAIIETCQRVRASTSLPLFVKLQRDYTNIVNMAEQISHCCDGLVMFGYGPEVDITLDDCKMRIHWGGGNSGSTRRSLGRILRVRAALPQLDIAANGGISEGQAVIKSLIAGATVTMMASALYRNGPDVIRQTLDSLRHFMSQHQLTNLDQLRQMSPLKQEIKAPPEPLPATVMPPQEGPLPGTPPGASPSNAPWCHSDRYGHVQ